MSRSVLPENLRKKHIEKEGDILAGGHGESW